MSQKRLARQVLLATPTPKEKRPRKRLRIRWNDHISDLAWSRPGVEPADFFESAVDRVRTNRAHVLYNVWMYVEYKQL